MPAHNDAQHAGIAISPKAARVITAAIDVNTGGPTFWAMHGALTAILVFLVIGSWSATVWMAVATIRAQELGIEALGTPFFGFFAVLTTILCVAEVRFLDRARR